MVISRISLKTPSATSKDEPQEKGAPSRLESTFVKKTERPFRVGEQVIWWKRVPGGYVFPVSAEVLALTAKRVKIEAEDDGEIVIRSVPSESLQRRD